MLLEKVSERTIEEFEAQAALQLEEAWICWQNDPAGLTYEDAVRIVRRYRFYVGQTSATVRLILMYSNNAGTSAKIATLTYQIARYNAAMQSVLFQLKGQFSQALHAEHVALGKAA